jgi:hypothetical protein
VFDLHHLSPGENPPETLVLVADQCRLQLNIERASPTLPLFIETLNVVMIEAEGDPGSPARRRARLFQSPLGRNKPPIPGGRDRELCPLMQAVVMMRLRGRRTPVNAPRDGVREITSTGPVPRGSWSISPTINGGGGHSFCDASA